MQNFHHQFDSVEKYLHHRPPYLLVERIVSIEENSVQTEMKVREDEFYIQGHFPGAHIMPGAMMQELTTQTAGILIAARHNPMQEFNTEDPFFNEYALGVLVKVKQARYKHFARPGDHLIVDSSLTERLGNVFDFAGRVSVNGTTILRNQFQLMNIQSKVLQGASAD